MSSQRRGAECDREVGNARLGAASTRSEAMAQKSSLMKKRRLAARDAERNAARGPAREAEREL